MTRPTWICTLLFSFSLAAQAHSPSAPFSTSWIDPQDIQRYQPVPEKNAKMSEKEFQDLLQNIQRIYSPIVSMAGGRLAIQGNWRDETPNASAAQLFGSWQIKVSGGLARHPQLTADGLTLIVCHELGHHLGGFAFTSQQNPFEQTWAANEGQSDYFSTHVCARRVWAGDLIRNQGFRQVADAEIQKRCDAIWSKQSDQELCYRSLEATHSMIATMAALKGIPMPQFNTPDTNVVDQTASGHPHPQCRMDTVLAGALCSANFDERQIPGKTASGGIFGVEAEKEAARVSCTNFSGYQVGLRPSCWFKARM